MLDPHNKLEQVHPDLVKVIRAAKQTPQGFTVVYGLRTLAAEEQAVASGHSTTMHSRHLPNTAGLACAVDLAALDSSGVIDWAVGRELSVYGHIAAEVKQAAHDLNIPIEWGGDWRTFKDWGHFQLPWSSYP